GAELDGPDVVAVRVLDDGGQEHAVEYELVHRVLPAVSWALSFTRIDSGGARTHRLAPSRPTDGARHGRSFEIGGCVGKPSNASATRSDHRTASAFPTVITVAPLLPWQRTDARSTAWGKVPARGGPRRPMTATGFLRGSGPAAPGGGTTRRQCQ